MADSPAPPALPEGAPPIDHLLGPILIAVMLNSFVYGVVCLHWIQYTLARSKDGFFMKLLVHWCFISDTSHSAAALYMLWMYSINNFANLPFLFTAPWPFVATPLWTVSVSLPIQHLFAWRIKQFTNSWIVFAIISALSIASSVLGVLNAIKGLTNPNVADFAQLVPLADTWLAVAVVCDVILAGMLYHHLMKLRTGFQNTNTVIGRLVRASIETTALTALVCILDLAFFSTMHDTNFHMMFALPMGRIYTVTLLSTLNSRTNLREELMGTAPAIFGGDRIHDAFQISERIHMKPTEVTIAVEREVDNDQHGDRGSRGSSKADLKMAEEGYSFTPM